MLESFAFATDDPDIGAALIDGLRNEARVRVLNLDQGLMTQQTAAGHLGRALLDAAAAHLQTPDILKERVAVHFRLPATPQGRAAVQYLGARLAPRFAAVVRTSSPLLEALAVANMAYILDGKQDPRASLSRLVAALFAEDRLTPTQFEYAMHVAFSATLRSAAIRGGVGASIVDDQGDVLAVGTAEVPKAGGGQYWSGDPNDARDYTRGYDPATKVREETVEALLSLLSRWNVRFHEPLAHIARAVLTDFDAQTQSAGVGHGSPLAQSFESLGRVVHAEMAALCFCARHGVPVANRTMITTASPCRQCLRHLICSGISRVVYLGKDIAAPDFHRDAVSTSREPGYVSLEPFVGVAPGLYEHIFSGRSAAAIQSIWPALLWWSRDLPDGNTRDAVRNDANVPQ